MQNNKKIINKIIKIKMIKKIFLFFDKEAVIKYEFSRAIFVQN